MLDNFVADNRHFRDRYQIAKVCKKKKKRLPLMSTWSVAKHMAVVEHMAVLEHMVMMVINSAC